MPVISYFNLNKIYILNSAFFLTIIFVGIVWMHIQLHTQLMTKTNNVCDDPIAKFFNKKAADKCILDKIRKDTMWIETKIDNNVIINNDKADEKNIKVTDLLDKYTDLLDKYRKRNEKSGIDVANGLYKQNEAVGELKKTASVIKGMYYDTETEISSLYDNYSTSLKESIDYIKKLADIISLKLTSNIYVKKKSYKKKRKSLSKSYNKLAKRLKVMVDGGVADPNIGFLPPLTYLQRNGKR